VGAAEQEFGGVTTDWNALWGYSDSRKVAVGNDGNITASSPGTGWSLRFSGTLAHLYGVWGSSQSDVFSVGASGVILHDTGSNWVPQPSGVVVTLRAVSGTGPADVFAVGDDGTILHYDGNVWSRHNSGTTTALRGVWARGTCDVFAVGDNGTILHYGQMDGGTPPDAGVPDAPTPDAQRPDAGCGTNCGGMVAIPRDDGSLGMGCNGDSECAPDERPWHLVIVPTFYIDRTEVTQAAYNVCVTAGACTMPGCKWDPVTTAVTARA
jgi:hypothetical protein